MTTPNGRSETAFLAGLPGQLRGTGLPARISSLLEEAIVSGALLPGQRLRVEVLAEHYGVSPVPVREALRSLQAAGWVKIRPRYGAYVAERSEQELRDVFDVRAVLEGQVARRAAERRTEADLHALRQATASGKRAAARGDGSLLRSLHAEFHAGLRAAARNDVLQATSEEMDKRARFYFSIVADSLRVEWLDVHDHLLAAVEEQDGDVAERLAREHVEETGQAVERLLR